MSPANPVIGAWSIEAAGLLEINEIDDQLARTQMLGQDLPLHATSSDDHHLGVLNHWLEAGAEKRANVRNNFLDVLPVGADEMTQRDVVVPDLDLAAFAEQPFHQLHLRTLAQIVGGRLEA